MSAHGRWRKLSQRLAVLVIVGTATATALAAASPLGWAFDLFAHFRVEYLVLQLLAGAVLLLTRAWGWMALLLAAAPNLVAVGPYLPGLLVAPVPVTPADAVVRLNAFNLQFDNPHTDEVRRYLDGAHADILVLSEFTPRWRAALGSLDAEYPYSLQLPRTDPWGMALYSRYPLREAGLLDLGYPASVNARAIVVLPRGAVEIFAIHLVPPTRPVRARIRNAQLQRLAVAVAGNAKRDSGAARPMPQIVAGDVNLTPFSPYFAALLKDSGLHDAGRPFGLLVSWPAWSFPLSIPIDHVLVGPRIVARRLTTGPGLGSDHFPLEFEFEIRN